MRSDQSVRAERTFTFGRSVEIQRAILAMVGDDMRGRDEIRLTKVLKDEARANGLRSIDMVVLKNWDYVARKCTCQFRNRI